jgi:organic hydroperoxide reductase OsmC/OhrA
MQRAKRFECTTSLDEQGILYAEGEAPIELPAAWTAEHLLLAAVVRCTLKSLRFYARGAQVEGSASMRGVVTRREEDARFALVEADVDVDVRIEPEPAPGELANLLERAELGCFVGNSLSVHPRYFWRVNGRPAAPAG